MPYWAFNTCLSFVIIIGTWSTTTQFKHAYMIIFIICLSWRTLFILDTFMDLIIIISPIWTSINLALLYIWIIIEPCRASDIFHTFLPMIIISSILRTVLASHFLNIKMLVFRTFYIMNTNFLFFIIIGSLWTNTLFYTSMARFVEIKPLLACYIINATMSCLIKIRVLSTLWSLTLFGYFIKELTFRTNEISNT